MSEELLTIGQTAKKLDCSSATVRNYIKRFGEFLSPSAQRQHRKRFDYNDLVALRNIKHRMHVDGLTYDEVYEFLQTVSVAEIIDNEEIPEQQTATPEQTDNALEIPQVFEFITQALNNKDEQHQREITAKDETIQLLREELERARLPWYKRISK